jgi:hypothetical protein
MKWALTDIWWASYHAGKTPWRWPSFNCPRKLQNEIFDIDIKSDLTASSGPKMQIWTVLREIWPWVQYKSYSLLFPSFQRLSGCLDTISGLGVMSFWTLTRLLHFHADGNKQSEKPELLTQNPTQSQETLNRKLVSRFLRFPTVIYMPSYDKRSRSYDVLNINHAVEIFGLIRFVQSENFKLLSLVQVQSQKTCTTKLVVNFLNFAVITHTLKSDKQRRCYDRWNTMHKWKNLDYRFWFGLMTISQNPAD